MVTPTNEAADALNSIMQQKLAPDTENISLSHDSAMTEVRTDDVYSTEFLNGLTTSELPPRDLHLRRGSRVTLLRNFAPHRGLCNGARLVVEKMYKYILVARIVAGRSAGNAGLLPRITCDSCGDSELPFVLRRHQFPVQLAWAIAINKAQGQSIGGRLGI